MLEKCAQVARAEEILKLLNLCKQFLHITGELDIHILGGFISHDVHMTTLIRDKVFWTEKYLFGGSGGMCGKNQRKERMPVKA